jgi:hypothetical protein
VPAVAFYGSVDGFSQRHLVLARSAFAALDSRELLHLRAAADPEAAHAAVEAVRG